MNIQGDEWRTLVAIPAVVALIVNLLTPLAQRLAISMLASSAARLGGALSFVIRVRIRQIDRELQEMHDLVSSPIALLAHYRSTIFYVAFGLWVLLLAPVAGVAAEALAARFAQYLPGLYGQWFSMKGTAFVTLVGAAFACGPFQATIYSSYVRGRLRQLAENPADLFAKLEAERARLGAALGMSASRPTPTDSEHE
jgi:hypothetical protein